MKESEGRGAEGGHQPVAFRHQSARVEQRAARNLDLLTELRAAAHAAIARKNKLLAAKYGANPFPEIAARIEGAKSEGFDRLYKGEPFQVPFSEMYAIESEATARLKCAEAEEIVLGQVAPSTAAALADCERRALELVARARREHEAKEERRRREKEEGERRHRELLERTRPTPRPPDAPGTSPQPTAPQWRGDPIPVPHSPETAKAIQAAFAKLKPLSSKR